MFHAWTIMMLIKSGNHGKHERGYSLLKALRNAYKHEKYRRRKVTARSAWLGAEVEKVAAVVVPRRGRRELLSTALAWVLPWPNGRCCQPQLN
jgi:hypothetical protein